MTAEDRIQKAIVDYLRAVLPFEALVFAVPNGGRRSKATAGILKATGVQAGVSDLMIIVPGFQKLICAEIKTAKGKLSPMQRKFGELVEGAGHLFCIWRSIDDARATLQQHQIQTKETLS